MLGPLSLTTQSTVDGFFDPGRIKAMEKIIRHYTTLTELDKNTVVQIACSLQSQQMGLERQQSSDFSSDCADRPDEEEDFTIDPVSSTTASKAPLRTVYNALRLLDSDL
jgi:hypothetical protein